MKTRKDTIILILFISITQFVLTNSNKNIKLRTFTPDDNNYIKIKFNNNHITESYQVIKWIHLQENQTSTITPINSASAESGEDLVTRTRNINKKKTHRFYFPNEPSTTRHPEKIARGTTTVKSTIYLDFFERNINLTVDDYDITTPSSKHKPIDLKVNHTKTNLNSTTFKTKQRHARVNDSNLVQRHFIDIDPVEHVMRETLENQKDTTDLVPEDNVKTEATKMALAPAGLENRTNNTPRKWSPLEISTTPKIKTADIMNISETNTSEICPHYKHVTKLKLHDMYDIWETVYYKMPEKVNCFRILIKKVNYDERVKYKMTYGNISNIDWDDVEMEVRASSNIGRRHFLLKLDEDFGIISNIIVEGEDTKDVTVRQESPDQWLIHRKLLLMRDCTNGGLVVFAKVPHVTTRSMLEEALAIFQDEYGSGELACGEHDNDGLRRVSYNSGEDDFLLQQE